MTRPPKRPRLGVAVQRGGLDSRYRDAATVQRHGRLVWLGPVTATGWSATYEVLIDHSPGKSPLVYVARPHLQLFENEPLQHVYSYNTLCLYLGDKQWNSSMPISTTLVPWAAEWLMFYELWAAGAGWQGKGAHPSLEADGQDERPPTPRDVRRHLAARDAKYERLTSALRLAYGRDADMDDLLFNAHLKPVRQPRRD